MTAIRTLEGTEPDANIFQLEIRASQQVIIALLRQQAAVPFDIALPVRLRFRPTTTIVSRLPDSGVANMLEAAPGSKRGTFFIVAVLAVFMQAGLWSARRTAHETFPDNSLIPKTQSLMSLVKGAARPTLKEHPIPKLMADAELNFRNLLARQSKTLPEAVAEYKRRFSRDPPKGFNDWWKFIQDNGVLMVDEYNAITEDLEPFWDLSPAEFKLRATLVSDIRLPRVCSTAVDASRPAICPQSR